MFSQLSLFEFIEHKYIINTVITGPNYVYSGYFGEVNSIYNGTNGKPFYIIHHYKKSKALVLSDKEEACNLAKYLENNFNVDSRRVLRCNVISYEMAPNFI